MNINPLDSIQNRLEAIEDCLSKLDHSFILQNNHGWERGVEVASEVFGLSNVIILMNIGKISHFKLRGIYYFNRKVLKDFIANNAYNVSILGLK